MKKIMVIGSSGAGKSTLARELHEITEIELFHLDRLFWNPGWKSISREELQEKIEKILTLDAWILDGNFGSTMETRIKKADTIIFLDFPWWLCLWNVIKRRFMYAGKIRPDMGEGCKEKVDLEFIIWVISFPYKRRKENYDKLEDYFGEKDILIFKNRKEARDFLSAQRKKWREKLGSTI